MSALLRTEEFYFLQLQRQRLREFPSVWWFPPKSDLALILPDTRFFAVNLNIFNGDIDHQARAGWSHGLWFSHVPWCPEVRRTRTFLCYRLRHCLNIRFRCITLRSRMSPAISRGVMSVAPNHIPH